MFKNWLINIIVNAIVLMMIAGYIHTFHFSSIWSVFGASVILSILNIIIRPILIILTLPVTIVTLGLFIFVINGMTLWIVSELMGPDFQIDGFGTAILASIIMTLCNLIISNFIVKPLRKR
ncbi:phage holin family protein [Terrilactibacillus laevilacticus]|uniref:Phage holin family protein n=1 Tax=Terrilactibacillus laevilacticus TaxID=1380157 RepID=A0ABW5PMT1_9BACI|nr:phage holin family protein [Terrilactibacillus laevilacticus]